MDKDSNHNNVKKQENKTAVAVMDKEDSDIIGREYMDLDIQE